MKIIYRSASLLLALIMCLAMLTGCGKKNETEATPAPTEQGSDIEESASPAPAETPEPTAQPSAVPTAAPATPEPTPAATAKPMATPTPTPAPTPAATPSPTPPPENGGIDLQAFYNAVNATYDMSNQSDMDTASLDAYYPGLSAIASKQFIAKMPLISAAVSEIILIECENESDVETVKSIFATRKQAQVDGGSWYPASIETWGSAQIVANGSFVMLVAHESAADIADSFNALFK